MAKSRIAASKSAPAEPVGNGRILTPPAVAPAPPKPQIVIPPPTFQEVHINIFGITPLVCSAFPDKERRRMIQSRRTDPSTEPKPAPKAGGGRTKVARPVRDFDQEYRDSLYPLDDGYGFPAIAFKRAIVGACRMVSNLDMTTANRNIFIHAPFVSKGFGCVRIVGKPRMREDIVRLAGIDKPPDVRYRGEFLPWEAVLAIEFNDHLISMDGIVNLILWAGKCEGVGEMRPSAPKKPNDFGQFSVKPREEKGGRS